MRRTLFEEMSEDIERILFRGAFPVYSYMYTLRPFMRMNSVGKQEVERFVKATAGKRLSVREIEMLAHGYFRGPASLRGAVDQGKWKWSLEQMQAVPEDSDACNQIERALLRDLEQLLKAIGRVMARCDSERLVTRVFYAQANLLVAGVLSRRESFFQKMEELYDRSGHASSHLPTAPGGDVSAGDQPPLARQPQCRAEDRPAARKGHSPRAEEQNSH
jgi:hypothetical protein